MVAKIKTFFTKYTTLPIEVKASLWYTICSILQKCISFVTLPIFTRLLTTEQYGQYTIYTSWMSMIIIFSTLNLQYGSFSTAMSKFEDDRDTYISSVQGVCLTLTFGMLLLYLLNPAMWNNILELPTILVVTMFFEILGSTFIAFWSTKERFAFKYKQMVVVTLIISILSPLIGIIGVMTFEEKGLVKILANAFVYIVMGGIFFLYNLYKGKKLFVKKYWKYALSFNIPLVPYYLSQMIFNQSDRIMISHMCGKAKAGIYGVAFQFSIILSFVINSINNSYVPWTYANLKKENYQPLKKVSNMLLIFVAGLLLLLIFFAPEVIRIMAGNKYVEAIWVVPPVAASMLFLFLSQMSINIMFFYEKKSYLVKGSILSAVLNLVLNYFCIEYFGYIAAGYTTLALYIVFWLCNYYYMEKVCFEKIKDYKKNSLFDFKSLVFISFVFLVLCGISLCLYLNIIMRYVVLIIVLLVLCIFRKKVKLLIDTIKSLK